MQNNKKEVENLISVFEELLYESLEKGLGKKYFTTEYLQKLFKKAKESFTELLLLNKVCKKEKPRSNSPLRFKIKFRRLLMSIGNLEFENEIEDEILKKAVKLLKQRVISEREKEKFSACLSEHVYSQWSCMDFETIEEILKTLDDLLKLVNKMEKSKIEKISSEITKILVKLLAFTISLFEEEKFYFLKEKIYELFNKLSKDEKIEVVLNELSEFVLEETKIKKCMLKAYSGLFLGDLILSTVGKALGIKEKLSITEFIIFLGIKIIEKEYFASFDRKKAQEIAMKLK